MTTLREAAQQALDDLRDLHANHNITYAGTISRLEAALAQEQPNPPGCEHCNHPLYAATKCRVCGRVTEQAEPVEPVAWLTPRNVDSYSRPDLGYETSSKTDYGAFPVYTAPPQRKPLTDEDAAALIELDPRMLTEFGAAPSGAAMELIRRTERAHGIGGSDE